MTLLDASTGLERIAREATLVLLDELNDELTVVQDAWAPLDVELATKMSVTPVAVELQHFEPSHFHLGNRQSIVEAPVGDFPMISIMAYNATPGEPGEQFDQADNYADNLYVEIFCNAEDVLDGDNNVIMTAEDLVNRRIQRSAEAVTAVLRRNLSLNGLVLPANKLPSVNISDVFARKEKQGRGRVWWWQGCRIEYVIDKTAVY